MTQKTQMRRELRGMMRRSDLIGKRHLNREERPFAGERSFFVEIHSVCVILCILMKRDVDEFV